MLVQFPMSFFLSLSSSLESFTSFQNQALKTFSSPQYLTSHQSHTHVFFEGVSQQELSDRSKHHPVKPIKYLVDYSDGTTASSQARLEWLPHTRGPAQAPLRWSGQER
ncbi:hypothetical protein EV356DRAFT_120866 [Viridothelium virens]|uniref:Uncharacterized protein n=1 Tax=Viridothelium virens TaxID=1048519 RepID=A0A6A6HBY9_VIRVR|nr:hypothetical protein EV356DRAFT_120866 [Viridothelium virens]